MSADNWGVCPRCWKKAQTEYASLVASLDSAYGTVPLAVFDDMRKQVQNGLDEEDFLTFREDYEFYVRDELLHIRYSGWCQKCGCGIDVEDTRKIDV